MNGALLVESNLQNTRHGISTPARMDGRLIISTSGNSKEILLGKQSRTEIGGEDFRQIQIGNLPSGTPLHAVIEWDWTQSNWSIIKHPSSECPIQMGGGELADSIPFPLIHQSTIWIGQLEMRFERVLAEPVLDGEPVSSVDTKAFDTLIVGRGPAKGDLEPGCRRLCLDAEDLGISSRHVVIENRGGRFQIRDESKFGAFLNGSAFGREDLVYGDRFRVGDYVFEFLVSRIRRVDHDLGGSIQARSLRKIVGKRVVILDNINLDIRPGEFVGILGGSGQGKSTLMNALCGINPATQGKVWINGVEISDRTAMMAAGIGYVPQDDIVHRELTVCEAVKRSALLRLNLPEHAIDDLINRVLRNLGLEEHRGKRIRNLSGGQRKRVSIATELLSRPSVLFLDEPTSGLDPSMESELMGWLQNLSDTGTTVICTTHVLENAHLFDRLLVVQGGRVIFSGDHMEMREHFLSRGRTETGSTDGSIASQSMGGKKLASLVKVYEELERTIRTAEDWERQYLESRFCKPISKEIRTKAHRRKRDRTREVGSLVTLWNLIVRQWLVLKAAPLNVLFLMAQAVLIGLMVGWVAEGVVLRGFLAVVATLWFGCSNGAQQIVGELPIFRRERVSGQGLNPYVFSKFLFLTSLTSIQAVILILVIFGSSHLFHDQGLAEGKDVRLEEELVRRLFPEPAKKAKPGASETDPTQSGNLIEPMVSGRQGDDASILRVELVRDFPGTFTLEGVPNVRFTVANPKEDWISGATAWLPTGQRIKLPDLPLPDYPPGGITATSVKPGAAESPFAPGAWSKLGRNSRDLWTPGGKMVCSQTNQVFALPHKLPAWPTETYRFRLALGFLRFFSLEDAFLDSGKSPERPQIEDLSLPRTLALTLGLKLITLLLTACVGVAIGLTISALVQNETQAVMWVPLVLIPQILFGGFVVTVPEMPESVRFASRAVPSFAAQRAMDVSHVFGRIVPKMTNETKMPVFSEGVQEEVTWTEGDRTITERYDKEIGENTSWQNLLVVPDLVGKRQVEKSEKRFGVNSSGFLEPFRKESSAQYTDFIEKKDIPSTVDHRKDTRPGYVHQTRFEYFGEAQIALATLGIWLLGCYSVILAGLISKQTGK